MTTAPSAFDLATAVHALGDGPDFAVDLHPSWSIGGRPHGGYLQAVIARAAGAASILAGADHPVPVATSTQYVRSPSPAPAVVHAEVLRTGRAFSQVRGVLRQDGQDVVQSLLTFGHLVEDADPVQLDERLPTITPFAECQHLTRQPDGSPIALGIAEVVDLALDPAAIGFGTAAATSTAAAPAGVVERPAEILGWMAFTDERPQDPYSLLFTVDVSPPTTLALGLQGWVPTLELTSYVRALPAPGPVRFRQRSRLLQDGLLDEVCDVWDSAGRLVAQATQLAAVRLP